MSAQESREEVTFVSRAQSAGANFGWPCREGDVDGPGTCEAPSAIEPAATYPETNQPVVGGYVARHPSLGDYQGRYLFGRFGGEQLHWMSAGGGPVMNTGLNIPSLTSFGEDGVGRLYVTGAGNYVARLVRDGQPAHRRAGPG